MKTIAAVIVLLAMTPAYAIDCRDRPANGDKMWRIIDGKRCWYQGRKQVPKSALRWAAVAADQAPRTPPAPAPTVAYLSLIPAANVVIPPMLLRSDVMSRWDAITDLDEYKTFSPWAERIENQFGGRP